ncbi:MAG: hypothetical protein JNK02_09340 [Planctomycetes bacterium]|nr:hypothetical protein [Planctomycetota bacterium]
MSDVLCLYPGPASFRQAQVAAHRGLLEALGVRLVLADDYEDPGDRACFHDVIRMPPPWELAAGKRALDAALAGRELHGVLAQSEAGLCLGALVAAERGLPGLSPAAALAVSSKLVTRRRLSAAGVAQPAFALARDAAGVRAFAAEHGYPVVLKAVASALARLVTLVRDEAAVEPAVARLRAGLAESVDVRRLVAFAQAARLDLGHDPLDSFLVESFARGLPLETDGVVSGTGPVSFGVTEQILTPPPHFFFEGYLNPAEIEAEATAAVEALSAAALRALDVRETGYSIELRLDGRAPSILEVNGRLGWDAGFGDLFACSLGVQPVLLTLRIALGLPVEVARAPGVHAALAYSACYADRVVTSVPDPDLVRAVERELDVLAGTCVWPGERIHAPPHPDATPHLAWALARDPASSRQAYVGARRALTRLAVGLAPLARD